MPGKFVYIQSLGVKLCKQTVSQNQGVSLIIIVKLSALVLMGIIEMAKVNIFLSLDWMYISVLYPLTMESNLATVNLSDFSHSLLICSNRSLEMISLLEFLCACLGHAVHVCVAGFGVLSRWPTTLSLYLCHIIIFCLVDIQIIYPMLICEFYIKKSME